MTPPQKYVDEANKLVNYGPWPIETGGELYPRPDKKRDIPWQAKSNLIQAIALALQTSHDEGVREEREACAKVALDYMNEFVRSRYVDIYKEGIAQAIRQRSSN